MKIIASAGAAAIAAGLLIACGGGGGASDSVPAPSANVPGTDVPLAATQDPDAAFRFVASVASSANDSADPLIVGDAKLATSDTEEPKSP